MSILVFICVWFQLEMEEKLAHLKLFIESAILFYFLSSHFSLLTSPVISVQDNE